MDPFYSEEEFRKRLEKLKKKAKEGGWSAYYLKGKGYWNWIYPELDKELLTYEQKKIVAREIFTLLDEICEKGRTRIK